ncbi:MAG TPA: hypothetical protein DSN98_06765 [Thermoplasmata archaeon]|jgi:hypothetical protein|nr:MAG TPA: hypothetical protein DSN98_06765 [Thermoplasmata archaeon]
MKRLSLNKYSLAAILLFGAATVYIAIALIANPGEITTSASIIAGLICIIIGVFTLAFSAGEPVDPQLIGLLPAQGSLNFNLLTKHLGYRGNAHFLPPRVTGEATVFQFNPTSTYEGMEGSAIRSFHKTGPPGLVTPPSCNLLFDDLQKNHALVIPDNKEELTSLIRETIEDFFKFAPRVSIHWEGSKVAITFHDYPYIDGCMVIAQKSPQCCAMSPCPACSLCGVLIAEGLDNGVKLERCSVSSSSNNVTAVFSLLP